LLFQRLQFQKPCQTRCLVKEVSLRSEKERLYRQNRTPEQIVLDREKDRNKKKEEWSRISRRKTGNGSEK
jgi:hypothetical protein